MPFDATPIKPITRLIEALKDPASESGWDFAMIDHCACGLARKLGMVSEHRSVSQVGRALGIPGTDALIIFAFLDSGTEWHDKTCAEMIEIAAPVRPRHVAAALEHYRDTLRETGTGEAKSPFHFVGRV